MRFMTSWRERPGINYCRGVIRNTTIHYEQMQQPCDLATILEDGLFADASSEDEYMNQETLTQRLLTQLDKLQATKYSQQVPCSIDNNKYGLSNTDMSHPTFLQEAVSMPNEFSSFGAFPDMNLSPSNLNTGFQSPNSPFQLQHPNDVEMDLIQYGDCLGSNQKNESMAFFTTMGNSQQSESLNFLMPQNVSREISDVPNLIPNMNSNWQSPSVGNLWQDQPLKSDVPNMNSNWQNSSVGNFWQDQPRNWDFLPDFNHLEQPYDHCSNASMVKTGSCFVDQGANCYPMLGPLKQTHLPTKNHYGEKQLLCANSNLKSNKRDTYDSSGEFERMRPSKKRVKTDPAFGVSSINNFTYNLPAPEMVQPRILEETSVLNKQPVSPLDEILQLYYDTFSQPTQDSTSISEVKNKVIDETFGDTFKNEIVMAENIDAGQISKDSHPKSHHVTANNKSKEHVIILNSSTHTLCNDPSSLSDIENVIGKNESKNENFLCEGRIGTPVSPEMVQPCILEETSVMNKQPVSPLDENFQLYYDAFSHPTQDSTSISEVKNMVIDETFEDTFKSEIVMAENIDAGPISEKSHSKSHHVTANKKSKEDVKRLNSSTHTLCNDPSCLSDIEDMMGENESKNENFPCEGRKGTHVSPEMVQPSVLNKQPQSPLPEFIQLHMEQFLHPTQDSTSISEVKNMVIDETFGDTFKSEIVMAENIDAGQISKESHPKSHHVTANNKSKEDVNILNSSTHTLCNDPSSLSDIEDLVEKNESKNENFLCEGHKGTHVSEEPHSKSHQVITMSNNSSAHTPCNDSGAIAKIKTEIGKMVANEVEEQEDEPEKETNLSNSTVYGVSLTDFLTCDQIREHIMSFGQHFGQTPTTDQEEISDNTCQLCGMDELSFAPLPIYCQTCGVRIKRNANYYYCKTAEEFDIDNCFCVTCYKKSGRKTIAFKGTSISKTSFDRKTNDEIINEPWVQCDKCKRWQHQICALYNTTTDMEGNSEYMCPMCCLNETEIGMREPLRKTNIFGAKDLPRTMLSEHIEQRLLKRLEQERADMAKIEGKNLDEVLVAENLCVRVVSSSNKQLKVEKQFLDIFSKGNDPTEFNYVTKAIFLFQKIEGVDVCLFSMYVQEFGSDSRHQNQRCVYISYLDSVKYLRPQRQAATGEALRTFIYHEILIGYLEYCKKRGFATCYIWSCPPTKGDDYILYCHPITQKTPKNDHLRHWLRKASEEKIAVGLSNMYDEFFDTSGKCDSKSKVTAARLPYFYGDYWSGAAINIVKKFEETNGGKNDVRKVKKGVLKKKRTSEHTNPPKASRDVQVMQELGKIISPHKEDFIIVQLQYACINCNEVIMSGKRWFCRECKIFQECERCHTADTHISSSGEKHTLCQVLVNDIPLHTKENDIILDNGLLDTRDKFLSFCQRNHFQFDTLRRAKHSSIMILHHLKNTTVLTVRKTCSICCKDNEFQMSWQCKICSLTICSACYKDRGASCHEHKLNQCSSTELCRPELRVEAEI